MIVENREIIISTKSKINTKSLSITEMINQNEYVSLANKKYSYKVYKSFNNKSISNRLKINIIKNKQKDKFNGFKYTKREILSIKDPADVFNNFIIFSRHTINLSLIKI